jgi:hypothetical protein
MRYLAVMLALFAQLLFSTHALATDLFAQADPPRQGGTQDEPAGVEGRSPYATPLSPYAHEEMTLEQQEAASRNSGASQEVNRNFNTEFADYIPPSTGIFFLIFVIAIVALVIVDRSHSVVGAVKVALFRLPSGISWATFWNVLAKASAVVTIFQLSYAWSFA